MQTRKIGPFLLDAEGRLFFGDLLVGYGDEFDEDAFQEALERRAVYQDENRQKQVLEMPASQLSFSWPTEPPDPLVNADDGLTVAEAHRQLWDQLNKGSLCPVCLRHARRYRRAFHKEMAVFLVQLVRRYLDLGAGRRFVFIRELPDYQKAPKSSSDGAYLPHWLLIKRGEPGYYMPTERGVEFVRGRIRVPKYAWIFGNHAHHFSDETIGITEALSTEINVLGMLRHIEGYVGK